MQGIVMRSTGSWYDVRTPEGEIYACRLRGKFKIKELKVNNPLAVGDYVVFAPDAPDKREGLITEILDRDNYIIRKSVHKSGHGHILAANLDQAILIATLAFPRTSMGFIDRFLVTTETYRIPAGVIFNKLDIMNEEGLEALEGLKELYESLGYSCLFTSAITEAGLDELSALLAGKKSLLSGHSGVGKSTLVNCLAPDLDLKTSEVSTFANKGVHTTTYAEMFEIAPQTFLIDTPGIKELGLLEVEKEEISHYFPEMRERFGECKYYNCRHINEPQCAIQEAVRNGEIALSRYHSYLSMVEDYDNRR